MEDVLDVYTRPYDPNHPQVCFDESSKQLVAKKIEPLPAEPGKEQRYDYQYERNGVCNLFMFFEPLAGWQHIELTNQRTAIDYAHQMKYLVDDIYPNANKITVVHDQLNTHIPSSLYKAFEPAEAKRILDKLEFHYTPKHGSCSNMAEIELSVFTHQCIDRRIRDQQTLKQEITAWEEERNNLGNCVDWQFPTADARIKLKRLYPSIQN